MRQDSGRRRGAAAESGAAARASGATTSEDASSQPGKTDESEDAVAATSSDSAPPQTDEQPVTESAGPAATGATSTAKTPPANRFARKDTEATARKSRLAGPAKKVKAGSDLIRNSIASVVWLIAVLAAVVLAGGALLIALGANEQNAVVEAVVDLANRIDGPFWKVFDFYTENKQGERTGPDSVKNHLVNWGLAAVAYLIGGRILDRVIRP